MGEYYRGSLLEGGAKQSGGGGGKGWDARAVLARGPRYRVSYTIVNRLLKYAGYFRPFSFFNFKTVFSRLYFNHVEN